MASSDYSSGFMHNTGHVLFSNEVYSIGQALFIKNGWRLIQCRETKHAS